MSAVHAKLSKILSEVGSIEKRGKNTAQNYAFVRAEDVYDRVRVLLVEHGVMLVPSVVEVIPSVGKTSKGADLIMRDVVVELTFTDVESGDSLTSRWAGAGSDSGGEKGLYKAFTGAMKSFLLSLFLVPSDTDPDTTVRERASRAGQMNAQQKRDLVAMIDPLIASGDVEALRLQLVQLGVTDNTKPKQAALALPKQAGEALYRWLEDRAGAHRGSRA